MRRKKPQFEWLEFAINTELSADERRIYLVSLLANIERFVPRKHMEAAAKLALQMVRQDRIYEQQIQQQREEEPWQLRKFPSRAS